MGRTGDATTQNTATEIVSVHLFARAYEAGQVISRQWIDSQLERLRSHPPGCHCKEPCDLSRRVTPTRTYVTAAAWAKQINETRALAQGGRGRPKRRMAR